MTMANALAHAGLKPSEILFRINNLLEENNPTSYFVTIFIMTYDPENGELCYANAGHNAPYVIQKDGQVLKLIPCGDSPCGWFRDMPYTEERMTLSEGDTVFLYTDGLNEAEALDGTFFGYDRIEQRLEAGTKRGFIEDFTEEIAAFTGGAEASDDLTMLTMQIERTEKHE